MENEKEISGPKGNENNAGDPVPPAETISREIDSGEAPSPRPETIIESPPSIDSAETGPSAVDEVVEEKEREKQEADEEFGKELELIGFRLNQEEYAIPIEQVKEIIRPIDLTIIPRSPNILLGIISLRGVIVPVFDLKKKLASVHKTSPDTGPGTPDEKMMDTLRRNIILHSGGGLLGLEVDSVTDVIRIREKEIEPSPPLLDSDGQDLIKGVLRFKNRMVILLNNYNMIGMIEKYIHSDVSA